MKKYLSLLIIYLFPLLFGIFFCAYPQNRLIQLKAAIHVSSTISEGQYSLTQIAQVARGNGLSVVIFTDRDLMKWEYGLWPFRKLIKKQVEHNSIFRYGIRRYLGQIKKLNSQFPGLILIAGTESAPFYYWQGSPLGSFSTTIEGSARNTPDRKKTLSELRKAFIRKKEQASGPLQQKPLQIHNWHQHLLAIGLKAYGDYINLPIAGNPRGLRDGLDILSLWPLLLLLSGVGCIKKGVFVYSYNKGRSLGINCKNLAILGVIALFLNLLFIYNNWPFHKLAFDQYHGDLGSMPYQNFIDYVNARGGLTFWAHPEAENIGKIENVHFLTEKHTFRLLDTYGYTGFCVFPEGYNEVGRPAGIWDELLTDYCKGLREKPIWAIGGLAFEKGKLSAYMKNLQNIILVSEKTEEAVLGAIREGRVYVVKGKDSLNFKLSEFFASDEAGKIKAFAGGTIKVGEGAILHIAGGFLNGQARPLEIDIIQEGKIVKSYTVKNQFKLAYAAANPFNRKTYYRIEIKGKNLHLVTNPIFVY